MALILRIMKRIARNILKSLIIISAQGQISLKKEPQLSYIEKFYRFSTTRTQ